MSNVTRILSEIEDGDSKAAEQLLPLVYDELRKLAQARLSREKPGQTLQATALVHDAYMKLVDPETAKRWESRGHFFGAAAEAMRRILVDNARKKKRGKHGGDFRRIDFELVDVCGSEKPDELLQIDETVDLLAKDDPLSAEIVKLTYFAGLPLDDCVEILGKSRATVYRHWAYAKAWLKREIRRSE